MGSSWSAEPAGTPLTVAAGQHEPQDLRTAPRSETSSPTCRATRLHPTSSASGHHPVWPLGTPVNHINSVAEAPSGRSPRRMTTHRAPPAKRRDGFINRREHGVWPDVGAQPTGRAHPVSTITISSQIEPPVRRAPKDSHDVVPVIRSDGSPVGLLSMATG